MNKNLLDLVKKLTNNDKKDLSQKSLKLTEETGELAKAVLPFVNAHGTTHRFVEKRKILEEVADVFLTAISIGYSLGYSDEDIEEMIKEKSLKWSHLQNKEAKVKYPIPYEIHVTVDVVEDVEKFKKDCFSLNVKPILLDLHLADGIMKDMMTSSVFAGNNPEAYEEMKRISDGLSNLGYKVIREKIETVPWHPAAPTHEFENYGMPKDCYFECHLNIQCSQDKRKDLKEIASSHKAHLSKNVFKRIDDDKFLIMITLRHYYGTREDFNHALENLKWSLNHQGFEVEKEIVEFSIFDTKVSHDASWIGKA